MIHELSAAEKCQFLNKMDILLQQIAESYILAQASLSTGILTQPMSMKQATSPPTGILTQPMSMKHGMHVCP